jgi:hypothetical protein
VLFATIGVLVAVYLVVAVGLRVYVTPGFLRAHMERLVVLASDGRYTVDFDEISVGWDLSIRILDGRLVQVPGADLAGRNRYEASFGRFSLEGVHLWPLLRHRRLHLREVRLRRPGLIVAFDGTRDVPSILANIRSRLEGAASGAGTIGLAFDEVVVLEGRVRLERDRDGARQTTRIDNIDLVIRRVSVGGDEAPLARADIRLSVGSYRRSWSDQRQQIDLEALTIANADSSLRVGRFAMAPPMRDEEFLATRTTRKDLIRVEALGIAGTGVDVHGLLSVPVYRATRLSADSLVVDVLSDHRLPPATTKAPVTPAGRLAELPTPVVVDSVVVRSGTIRYREIPSGGEGEGVVAFRNVAGLITGIGSATDPAIATMSARLFGTVPLSATVWIPLGSSHFNLRYVARAGPGAATAANPVLIPMEGVALRQGTFDSLWIEATVVDGEARGTLQAAWRDLKIELVDRGTGRAGLVQRLGSAAANALVVPANNPKDVGSDPRIGEIRYDATEKDSFFGFLWRTLRTGFTSLLGT